VDPSTVDAAPLAVDLAGFLRALQAVDTAGAGLFGSRGHPLSEPTRDRLTRASLAAAGDVVDAERALAVWEDAQAAPAWPGPPTWFHGDLNAGNLLTREGRLSAVLDWGPWGAGDPAVDLHAAYQLFDEASREQFRCEVGADHATWVRARGWAVSVAAMEIPYYRETRPEFAARSIAAIDAVLAE
jgi:aminoglycoside phosphotransferase (APT) family kinase protein